jgi:integrase
MASITVQLLTWKKPVKDEFPISLVIIKDRKRTIVSTGFRSSIKHWDEKKNMPKKSHPNQRELSIIIEQKKIEAQKLLLTLEQEGKESHITTIRNEITKTRKKSTTSVFKYFDDNIEQLRNAGRIGYSNVFKETKRALSNFRQGKDLSFYEVTHDLITKFDAWYLKKGNSLNSIFVFMRTMKTLINYAKREGLVAPEFDPFKDFSFKKYRRYKPEKRAIGKDEIKLIYDYAPKKESSLFHSRNYFIFSYLTRGTNFIDIAHLTWKNITKDNRMKYTRKKTGQPFDIGLLNEAMAILKYYRKNYYQGYENDYIFPILNKNIHLTAVQIDNRIEKVLSQTNKDLKSIGKKLGIGEKLTTYVARHSFATVLKYEGTNTSVISEMMGHQSERTTQAYLDSFEQKKLDEATKSLLWKK